MSDTATIVTVLLVLAWLVSGAFAAGHAIMFKRDPKSSALWAIVCFTVPILGPWFYLVAGINRVQRRAMKRLARKGYRRTATDRATDPQTAVEIEASAAHLTGLLAVADRVTRTPMVAGNELSPLHNGEQAYPAMLAAIERAKRSVTLASYIFDWDDVGRKFTRALGAAAARGVHVHVLLDGIGAVKAFSRVGRKLLRSGAEVAAFFPLRFPLGRVRINLRNHRKMLVVDGREGFAGGMNISQRHMVDQPGPGRTEDLHFKIVGPVVTQIQQVFVEDWYLATGRKLSGEDYFAEVSPVGPATCRGVSSGPDDDFGTVHWILQAAFDAAQHSVRIATPYFIPSPSLITSMALAAMRGVRITLALPSHVDHPFMRWAADAYLWQLLQHGISVYRSPPPFVHTKLLIVDEHWLLIGSANMDLRSFRLNFEFNVEAYDPALGAQLASWFDARLEVAQRVTLASVDARSVAKRLRDGFFRLFSPYL